MFIAKKNFTWGQKLGPGEGLIGPPGAEDVKRMRVWKFSWGFDSPNLPSTHGASGEVHHPALLHKV